MFPATAEEGLFQFLAEEDLAHEEELLRNPFYLKAWLRYLHKKKDAEFLHKCFLYERAVKEMPGSYKLWREYLELRRLHVEKSPELAEDPEQWLWLNHCYERALVFLHKMPRIWLDYCRVLMKQKLITKTRQTFDRALRSLTITQHERIWPLYLQFLAECDCAQTATRVHPRFIKLQPEKIEEYIDFLIKRERWDEACKYLLKCINDPQFKSVRGKSHYQLWINLAEIVCQHPEEIVCIRAEKVLRAGVQRFTDQVGRLWNALASYWIKLKNLEKARDVYEEALSSVTTVRDFTQVFDAYAEFQDSIISLKMENEQNQEGSDGVELDLLLARYERLMDRRPFLLNDVLLRQNPNNVNEWMKKVELHLGDGEDKIIEVYEKACETIQPKRASGRLQDLWIQYAKFHELILGADQPSPSHLDNARAVYERALQVNFKHPDSLAEVYIAYAEMEIRQDNQKGAVTVLGRGTAPPRLGRSLANVDYFDDSLTVQQRVFKSLKLWNFYVDLEETMGTIETARAVYERMLELKIVNAQNIINYATFLEENQYFEDAFRVYERGTEIFGYPISFEIWNIYLEKFMQRYGGSKLERARDLFERAVNKCPEKFAKPLYLLYGKLEEDYGLPRRAMQVYDRACAAVLPFERFEMFNFYIARAVNFFGLTSCRSIYEKAIETLPEKEAREMSLRFVDLEVKLGELDRARAIFGYASQMADPTVYPDFWEKWHDFEIRHGNEESFKEMLRIKRGVQAQFHSQISSISAQMLAHRQAGDITSLVAKPSETFIAGGTTVDGKPVETETPKPNAGTVSNPDALIMDDYMDEEDEEEDADGQAKVSVAQVPASVFQGFQSQQEVTEEEFE